MKSDSNANSLIVQAAGGAVQLTRHGINGLGSPAVVATGGGSNMRVTLNQRFASAWAGKTLSIRMQGTNTNYQSGTRRQLGRFRGQ